MKWLKIQGEIAMDGNFRKKGHGCLFFPTRSACPCLPISLVKSDWKLQQKIPVLVELRFRRLHLAFPGTAVRAMPAAKIDFRIY